MVEKKSRVGAVMCGGYWRAQYELEYFLKHGYSPDDDEEFVEDLRYRDVDMSLYFRKEKAKA